MKKLKEYCYCCAEFKDVSQGDFYCKDCLKLIAAHGFLAALDIVHQDEEEG